MDFLDFRTGRKKLEVPKLRFHLQDFGKYFIPTLIFPSATDTKVSSYLGFAG